jgi:Putative T7SS secretion signal domain
MADWSVLGESSDPIPGDPEEVAAFGKQLRETADMIQRQSASIKNLTSGEGWDSDAGDGFKKTAGDTADKLLKAYDRYDAAATALGETIDYANPERNWASALYHAQDEARKLLTKAE